MVKSLKLILIPNPIFKSNVVARRSPINIGFDFLRLVTFNLGSGITLMLIMLFVFSANAEQANLDEYDYDYNYASINNKCMIYDPYQSYNRKIFTFNDKLDQALLKPTAETYQHLTNDYIRDRVRSFLTNIREPLSVVNYAMQGNPEGSVKSFWRFAINSTLGIAGIFDVAAKMGLVITPQTFGNTLGYYGVGAGPYIVIPFLGGRNARDLMDLLMYDFLLNPLAYFLHADFQYAVTAATITHSRQSALVFTDYIYKNSTDPYISIRDAILNERESKMHYPDNFVCPKVSQQ